MSTTDLPSAAELADLAARRSPWVLSAETVTAAVELCSPDRAAALVRAAGRAAS